MSSNCRTLAIVTLVVAPLVSGSALPAELSATTRLDAVVVYPDRAEITRVGDVDVPVGPSLVVLRAFPRGLDAEALQVAGRGVSVEILSTTLRDAVRDEPMDAEITKAREEVELLQREMNVLSLADKSGQDLRHFLREARIGAAPQDPATGKPAEDPVTTLRRASAYLEQTFERLDGESVARLERRIELARELEAARATLAALEKPRPLETSDVIVALEAERAGSLTLELRYLVGAAGWRPAYRAGLDRRKGSAERELDGVVRQESGEDWTDVRLSLATSAPASRLRVPVLGPRELSALDGRRRAELEGELLEEGVMATKARRVVGVDLSGFRASYALEGRVTLPGDGRELRLALDRRAVTGETLYRVVPSQGEEAVLLHLGRVPEGMPMVDATMEGYADGALVGHYRLAARAPGEPIALPFGIDPQVAVERIDLPRERTSAGFIGKDRQVAVASRVRVINGRPDGVTIEVVERFPVSTDERIRVTRDVEATTPGFAEDQDRPGVVSWRFGLAPGESREIEIAYTVRHPRDLVVAGL